MCCGTVSFSHKKVAGWSLFWQAGTPDVAFAGLCIAFFALFLGANYPVSLTLGCCSDFAVAIGNLLSGFIPSFCSHFVN